MNPHTLESRIDEVTLFAHGALVTRVADLAGAAGARQVALRGLPLGLLDGSLRAQIWSDGRVEASSLRVLLEEAQRDDRRPPPQPESLKSVRREVARIEEQVAAVEREATLLRQLGFPGAPPEHVARFSGGATAFADFRQGELTRLGARQADLVTALREARRRQAQLEDDDRRASSQRNVQPHALRKTVVLQLSGDGVASRLALSYLVGGARWSPSYTVALDADWGQAGVTMRAAICQATGEDWSNVAVRLSTAEPLGFVELGELPARRIGRRAATGVPRGYRPPPSGAAVLYADFDHAWQSVPAPSAVAPDPARVEEILALARAPETVLAEPAPKPAAMPMGGAMPLAPPQSRPSGPRPAAPPGFAGAMPPPQSAPAPAPPPAQRARMARQDTGSFSADLSAGAEPELAMLEETLGGAFGEAPTPAAVIPAAMRDYAELRMPGPHDARRGSLSPASVEERYDFGAPAVAAQALAAAEHQARAVDALPLPAGLRPVERLGGFDHVFDGAARIDIPSDMAFHTVPVTHHTSAPEVRHVTVPREGAECFRSLQLPNPGPAPILEGPAEIYVDGQFWTTATLRTTPPGGRAALGLGVEQAVKVARNVEFSEEIAGLIGGARRLTHRIRIDVENRLARRVHVEVRERLPVPATSEAEDITLRVAKVEPAWEPWTQALAPVRGTHRWRLELAAKEKRELVVEYVIEIGSKFDLVGGNRREA